MEINIVLPDGTEKKYESGVTTLKIAEDIGERLALAAVAGKVNDNIVDLTTPITTDAVVKILTYDDPEGQEVFHHSAAHLLSHAVKRLFPDVKLTIGPAIDGGFYYDFDAPEPFTQEDLEKIEAEMKKIQEEDISIERIDNVNPKEAKEKHQHEPYKLEMINDLGDDTVTCYQQGEFYDLCRGPHLPNTGRIKAFKLTKMAGAYWRGDAQNKQLQRIYGIAFPDKKRLKEHLKLLEEAEKRDHRKIGKEMDLFSFHEEAPGMPFFHNKGTFIWNKLVEWVTDIMIDRDYEINKTPIILNKSLWLQSGHWGHYKENMYFTKIDEQDYAVKPMNCPGNILIFKNGLHSYRELPIRAGEFGLVHRHELSGVLSGLFRVRCFTQDDAHVFCTKEQVKSEVQNLLDFMDKVYSQFGFNYRMELSTRPEKAMGDEALWELAEETLRHVLELSGKEFRINEGDGAFYGPKIDFHLTDALGRSWQCGTIQLDFQMPEKFDMTYEGNDSQKHRPVMLHRAVLGSVERFMGILIEHYAGKFPLWINPVQAKILTVTDRVLPYAKEVRQRMKEKGLRIEIDNRSETISKKVRDAQLQKVNYILVIGDKEVEQGTVTVRTRDNEVVGPKKIDFFIEQMLEEDNKKI
jgi:threonyl-tRNA synthetase